MLPLLLLEAVLASPMLNIRLCVRLRGCEVFVGTFQLGVHVGVLLYNELSRVFEFFSSNEPSEAYPEEGDNNLR